MKYAAVGLLVILCLPFLYYVNFVGLLVLCSLVAFVALLYEYFALK